MKLYTKSGDKGSTSLYGGDRVDKDDVRVECFGTLDEANCNIGLLRVKLGEGHDWQSNLQQIQIDLMNIMSHLATPSKIAEKNKNPLPIEGPEFCEEWIDELENAMRTPSSYFLLPGGNEIAALCHVVRSQIRRAERRLVSFMKTDQVHESIPKYINRLSDLFFALGRAELDKHGLPEERWKLFLYRKFEVDKNLQEEENED